MSKAARQGDVLIVPCREIPGTAREVAPENGRLIVARGEATGHHHSFPWTRGATLFRDDGGGSQFVSLRHPTPLEHQEHGTITLPAGKYRVLIQRTMTAGIAARVTD